MSNRSLVVIVKGDSQPVVVSSDMVQGGWLAGQGVQWAESGSSIRLVTYSTGFYGGYLWMGSDEDEFTGTQRSQPTYRWATMFSGGSLIATSVYEKYTYASRIAGPLVPIVYGVNQPLYFSLRGRWTPENELSLTGDPRGSAPMCGVVSQVPKEANNLFLGVQTFL